MRHLRPARPAAPPIRPAQEDTPAPADEAIAGDGPDADESFESATTVPLSVLAGRDPSPGQSSAASDEPLRPPPPLDDIVAAIPEDVRQALEQLFRARFRAVRRITPEQLR